jgi:hypothetical protein
MLNKEETLNPSAIEEHFCKPLDKFKPKQLSEQQMQLMLVILMTKDEDVPKFEKEFSEVYWFYEAIEKRINSCFTYTMDVKAKVLLATWCESIGDVVMYLTLLQYKCKQRGVKNLTCEPLGLMFGDGIIDRAFMHEIWDKQKVYSNGGSDNLIDYATALKSLRF